MEKARQQLEEFRRRQLQENPSTSTQKEKIEILPLSPNESKTSFLSALFSLDVLNTLPFRLWRSSYEHNPCLTLFATIIVYLIAQVYFVWIQFGLVFFTFSVLIAIGLGLGQRKEGEVSAYSVFNENCERLLGQMTAEHFERDVLQKRRPQ